MRHRSDGNQQMIIASLRKIGCQVFCIGEPVDLIVSGGALGVINLLMECKMPGEKLSASQQEFWMRWPGQKCVVHGVQEALEAVLGKEALR